MQCLYEVLGVSRDSSQEEIRSAYKRLALQLHPDKLAQSGASGGADATAAFQELLHAYEVLSDPKERAWYDSHRSQILFSDPSSASKSRSSFFDLDLFSFFSKSVYSGYTDSGKGFFKVYGDLFAKIYAQELHFAEKLGLPSEEVAPAPLIGNLDSPYSQVTAFYGYWLGYTTILDFSWADEYDSFSGPNRKWRRLMEEENKKARKKAKREHIDTVRGLAAFVKKRDKRVLDMQMKKKQEDEKRQADEMKRRKEEERKRKQKAMMYQECEWVKNDDEEIKMSWDKEEEENRKKKNDIELYCVACNKKFKSDKQWKNHEQSKKHREKIAELRSTFDEEEDTLKDVGQAELCASFDYEPQAQEDETSDNDSIKISKALKKDLNLKEEVDDDANKSIDDLPSNAKASGPANDYGNGNNTEYHTLRNRKSRRANRETRRQQLEVRDGRGGINGSQEDDNEVHDSNVGGHLEDLSYTFEDKSDKLKGDQAVHSSQNPKKVELNGIELAKKETTPAKSSLKGKKQKAATKEPNNSCGTCGEIFDSRNKLFAHLSNTGHAKQKS